VTAFTGKILIFSFIQTETQVSTSEPSIKIRAEMLTVLFLAMMSESSTSPVTEKRFSLTCRFDLHHD
jgi:hypothetical protein